MSEFAKRGGDERCQFGGLAYPNGFAAFVARAADAPESNLSCVARRWGKPPETLRRWSDSRNATGRGAAPDWHDLRRMLARMTPEEQLALARVLFEGTSVAERLEPLATEPVRARHLAEALSALAAEAAELAGRTGGRPDGLAVGETGKFSAVPPCQSIEESIEREHGQHGGRSGREAPAVGGRAAAGHDGFVRVRASPAEAFSTTTASPVRCGGGTSPEN